MPIKVLTVSTCDRCGQLSSDKGNHGQAPPEWAVASLATRLAGGVPKDAWTSSNKTLLCPECAKQCETWLKKTESGV